jgi:anti-sigma regulatory factor (Ser/Thr protein kinase)
MIYQIILTNQIEKLDKLSNWLNPLVESLNISSQIAFQIDLILSEIVTNIIENAYDDQQTHPIKIELQYLQNQVMLCIEDDGVPFNPLESEKIVLSEKLEDAKIGGLGIHLMRCYSDECYYERKNNKNKLSVIIYH